MRIFLIFECGGGAVVVDGDAETFAAEHEPHDAELPILEAIDLWMGLVVEAEKRAGSEQVFAATFAGGEEEGDVGNLLGQDIDGAIDPDDLLVGIVKGDGGVGGGTGHPGEHFGGELGDGDFVGGFLICNF
jgi:hypothetical protein